MDESWEGVKSEVMRAMTLAGEGSLVPSVASAQMKLVLWSNWL